MIPTNGTIQAKITSGGGIGEDGNPIAVSSDWGEIIPCRVQVNSYSNKGKYQDGKFTISSYTLFIQRKEFSANRLKLSIDGKETEFDIQSIELLKMVGTIKITV